MPDAAPSGGVAGGQAAGDGGGDANARPADPDPLVPGGAPSPPADAAAAAATAAAAAPPPPPSPPPRSARYALYAAHALSTSVGRGWEFGGALALLALAPGTLALPAALGLAEALAQAAGGAAVGRAVDAWPRFPAAARFVCAQAACTLLSAGAVLAALRWRGGDGADPDPSHPHHLTPATLGLGVVAVAGAAGAALAASGATVSVEREWCAALAGGDARSLAALNAGMRRIDLLVLLAAPAAVGGVLSGAGPAAGTAAVAGAAAAVVGPQLALLKLAQRRAPGRLAGGGRAAAAGSEEAPKLAPPPPPPAARTRTRTWCRPGAALATYAAAPAFPAGAALALLYCTVLSFGAVMTAYLRVRGLGAAELAGWRGAGAVAGLVATVLYPPARAGWGLDAAGGVGLGAQLACLVPAVVAALAAPASLPAARGLAAGLALSRAGLWGYDLAASQALQERVPPAALGTVNGVQSGAQAAASALVAAACLAFPQPARFGWLMVASLGVVSAASAVFWIGTAAVRRREAKRAGGGGEGGGLVEMGGGSERGNE